jgi:hypothetical protein
MPAIIREIIRRPDAASVTATMLLEHIASAFGLKPPTRHPSLQALEVREQLLQDTLLVIPSVIARARYR